MHFGLQTIFRVCCPCRSVNGSLELCNLAAMWPQEGVSHPQKLASLKSKATWERMTRELVSCVA